LLVLYDADRYADIQLENVLTFIHQQERIAVHQITAAVILARSEFLARLEHPALRAWLAQRLFVARLRMNELGADEIAPFIRHQLPEADKIFTDETIAAIAHISGGDPVVVNRFAGRMLGRAAAGNGDTLTKINFASETIRSPALPQKERIVTSLRDQPRRNLTTSAPDGDFATRSWRDKGTSPRLGAVVAFCFACGAFVVRIPVMHTVTNDLTAARTAPAADVSTKHSESRSSSDTPPARLSLAAKEVAALLARGDALLAQGDIASARLFYERAADAGDARAALKLGGTYDPVILSVAHVLIRGDRATAETWYRRARELGDPEAEIMLTRARRE
jgi:hypothetical protein